MTQSSTRRLARIRYRYIYRDMVASHKAKGQRDKIQSDLWSNYV